MGNHVNKLLKVILFSTIIALQKLLVKFTLHDSLLSGDMHASTNSDLVAPTQSVVNKFTEVYLLFGKCHDIYNGNVVDDPTIAQLGKIYITILYCILTHVSLHLP